MAIPLLIEYLERRKAAYRLQTHELVFTALGVARCSHISDYNMAKVVMIKCEYDLAMVVLPAHYVLDLDSLAVLLAVDEVALATEQEFSYRFPRCELGAMPPFGHLFGLQTYLVPLFDEQDEIAFNANTHTDLIRMPYSEYLRLAYAIKLEGRCSCSSILAAPRQAEQILVAG